MKKLKKMIIFLGLIGTPILNVNAMRRSLINSKINIKKDVEFLNKNNRIKRNFNSSHLTPSIFKNYSK